MVTIDIASLHSADPKVKYAFAKELLQVVVSQPEQLHPQISEIAGLLNNKNNILQWTGIDLIGYLSAVDIENKMGDLIPVLKRKFREGKLITTNHTIFALSLIALHQPQYKNDILKELLKIDSIQFENAECTNMATGKIVDALVQFVPDIKKNKKIETFIEQASINPRSSTQKKARMLLKKLGYPL